jgi:hypothetical protein
MFVALSVVRVFQVDENMKRAHSRDAVRTKMFHFRKHIAPLCEPALPTPPAPAAPAPAKATSGTPEKVMSNTERSIAAAIAAEISGSPCGPCNPKVRNVGLFSRCFCSLAMETFF